ncbi:hypothetical protein Bpfe_021030 [Biomphalaria pfeifferi]|uniref:Uncharacterized protein n=1 Tax=Biomphalaria pfeifferi TaxID=112525 RepID=A0AAD8B8U8_BIOPF|nr:hypothetical protein Bpfe_021030 [Biomphalaria pfeifferi]
MPMCTTRLASNIRRTISGIQHPGSSIQHPAYNIRHPISGVQYPASNIQDRASSIQHPAYNIRHPTSRIEHPASNIQHTTSSIQHLLLKSTIWFFFPHRRGALLPIMMKVAILVLSLTCFYGRRDIVGFKHNLTMRTEVTFTFTCPCWTI